MKYKGLTKVSNATKKACGLRVPLYYDIATRTANTTGEGHLLTYLINPVTPKKLESVIDYYMSL